MIDRLLQNRNMFLSLREVNKLYNANAESTDFILNNGRIRGRSLKLCKYFRGLSITFVVLLKNCIGQNGGHLFSDMIRFAFAIAPVNIIFIQ